MKNKIIIAIIFLLGFLYSCEDLEVQDLNNVKLKDVFSDPDLYPSFVEGVALDFWKATEWSWPTYGLSCAGQTMVSSFTNYGGQDMDLIPRAPFSNSTTYSFRSINVTPWQYLNTGIVKVNQIFKIMDEEYGGQVTNSEGVDITNRIKANGYFYRGLCLGHLGILYDKAYIVRPETEDIVYSPWQDVVAAALEDMENAVQIINSDGSVINDGFNGVTLSNNQFSQLASSYIAKLEAIQARDADEVTGMVDWNKVKTYAEQGLTYDFMVPGDGGDDWWSRLLERGQRNTSSRISQRLIKMMNPSKSEEEVPYPWPDGISSLPEIENPDDKRMETDFRYYSSVPFPASRGYYYYSNYTFIRYEEYRSGQTSPIPIFKATENNLLFAEALIRTGGSKTQAAQIINDTRVNRGGLPALTGSESDDVLLRAITYERLVEFPIDGFANGYFYRRITTANDLMLEAGQFLHLPIPAYELELAGDEIYTFGGLGNER